MREWLQNVPLPVVSVENKNPGATPVAVFTADNHLRAAAWKSHPRLQYDAYFSWLQICQLCVALKVPLLQLGDLFDSTHPDVEDVFAYMTGTQMLANNGLNCYFISGNHDCTDPAWASMASNGRSAAGAFTLGGLQFYGLNFTPAVDAAATFGRVPPGTQVVLAHQSWKQIQGVGSVDADFAMLPAGVLLLTGDYHVCKQYHGFAKNGEQVIAYSPGSTAMQALNEPQCKFVGILYSDMTAAIAVLHTRSQYQVRITTEAELEMLAANVAVMEVNEKDKHPVIRTPILHVRYSDTLTETNARVLATVGDRAHLFIQPFSETTAVAVPQSILQGSQSLEQIAVEMLELTPGKGTLYAVSLLQGLFTGSDMAAVYRDHRNRYWQANGLPVPV